MKTQYFAFVLAFVLVSSFTFGQDYAFKVMANKGSNEVKSGDAWQPIKTGASLKSGDELKLADNAYIGLIHASGKPIEIKQAGNYKVADLAAKVSGGTSVLNKYTDFILSSNAEDKKNKLSATGAVHRATGAHTIGVLLPENQNLVILNSKAVINWETEVAGPYLVTVANLASEELAKYEIADKSITLDLKDPKYKFNTPGDPFSVGLMVQVKSKSDPKQTSKEFLIRALPSKDADAVNKSFKEVSGEISDETAMNKLFLAGFYEENNLVLDAMVAYEEAIKLAPDVPDFKAQYEDFLIRQGIKK